METLVKPARKKFWVFVLIVIVAGHVQNAIVWVALHIEVLCVIPVGHVIPATKVFMGLTTKDNVLTVGNVDNVTLRDLRL